MRWRMRRRNDEWKRVEGGGDGGGGEMMTQVTINITGWMMERGRTDNDNDNDDNDNDKAFFVSNDAENGRRRRWKRRNNKWKEDEMEQTTTTTINIIGWKVERGRTDDYNDGDDDDEDNKDNNDLSLSPTFNLLEQLTTSEHGTKPWSKPIV